MKKLTQKLYINCFKNHFYNRFLYQEGVKKFKCCKVGRRFMLCWTVPESTVRVCGWVCVPRALNNNVGYFIHSNNNNRDLTRLNLNQVEPWVELNWIEWRSWIQLYKVVWYRDALMCGPTVAVHWKCVWYMDCAVIKQWWRL